MWFDIISLGLSVFALFGFWYYQKFGRMALYLRNFPGIPSHPILGNLNLLMNGLTVRDDVSPRFLSIILGLSRYCFHKEKIFVFWRGWLPMINIYTAEAMEAILSDNIEVEKGVVYDYLHPWLKTGLLTSTGDKWRRRRKLLTPTFHFRILEDFIPIINEHSVTLVERLAKNQNKIVDIVDYSTRCTLDVICETAMGVKMNAQTVPDSHYVKAIEFMGVATMDRAFNFLSQFDFIFYRTKIGKEYAKQLNVLHRFTRDVIYERKNEIIGNKGNGGTQLVDEFGAKKRLAFLDLLIEHNMASDAKLSDDDICEEVDTFMFEGHDTTAYGIAWALYLIGLYPEIQEKIHDELDSVFGDDRTRHITNEDIKQLKYLECCLKESQRVYPSVPWVARLVKNDFKIYDYVIPKGSQLNILIYHLHHNKDIFPEPEVYNPDRFLLENQTHLHPYAFVPFSAGPRNCIGQRFALSEEKIIIANVLRNFSVSSVDQRDKLIIAMEMILRPKHPLRLIFKSR